MKTDNKHTMANSRFTFTYVIVQDTKTNSFYGMVKEVEGVMVKGTTEEEVHGKIPQAIKAIMRAKKKAADESKKIVDAGYLVKEYEQSYEAVA